MQLARKVTVSLVRRDERGDCDRRRRGKQKRHLGNTTNVFLTVLRREAQVLVQTKTDVVAVQTVRRLFQVQDVLLERRGNRRLARRRKTCQPNRNALLAQELRTLVIRHSAGVEGDVGRHGGRKPRTALLTKHEQPTAGSFSGA